MNDITGCVFIATSLDGYIARPDGSLDWLPGIDSAGEDYGYHAFMDQVDALVMGRNTYDAVASFDSWPYGDKPVVVLTHRPLEVPGALRAMVTVRAAAPHELMRDLAARGVRRVYVDGGRTIQAFLHAGLIGELIITRVPVLLGSGIPLFGPLAHDVQLQHVETRSYANGLVQSRYGVV